LPISKVRAAGETVAQWCLYREAMADQCKVNDEIKGTKGPGTLQSPIRNRVLVMQTPGILHD